MKHRTATREDLIAWFGNVPVSMRVLVLEDDGRIVGVAGVSVMVDHLQAFSSQRPEAGDGKIAKARMAVAFKALLKTAGGPVFALCSETEPTAPGLLSHLGFRPITQRQWRYG